MRQYDSFSYIHHIDRQTKMDHPNTPRSVLMDTRVGRPRPDSALSHPMTKNADRFRHRAIARLLDHRINDAFSWEETYDGQIFWIEDLYRSCRKRRKSAHLENLLYIAIRVFEFLIRKLEYISSYLASYHLSMLRTTTEKPQERQRLSLAQWSRVHFLRNCEDSALIAKTPVPEKIKKFLLFDIKELMHLKNRLNRQPSII